MGMDLRQWVKDKGLEKWFRRDNLIVLVLAGILLFIVALPVKDKSDDKNDNDKGAAGQSSQPHEILRSE